MPEKTYEAQVSELLRALTLRRYGPGYDLEGFNYCVVGPDGIRQTVVVVVDKEVLALPAAAAPVARHSLDFRSVHWYGLDLSNNPQQAAAFAILWDAAANGTHDVGGDAVCVQIGADGRRLDHIFRGHPAWGTVVIKGASRGSFRLAPPPPGCDPPAKRTPAA